MGFGEFLKKLGKSTYNFINETATDLYERSERFYVEGLDLPERELVERCRQAIRESNKIKAFGYTRAIKERGIQT